MQQQKFRHDWATFTFHFHLSVPKWNPTLCDSVECSTPGFSVLHHFLKLAQVHVHCLGDAIQPSHPPMPSSSALNLSQHQGLSLMFASAEKNTGVSTSASVLPTSIQGWFPLRSTGLMSLLSKGLSGVFSSTTVRRHQFFGTLPSLLSNSHNRMWSLGRP